MYAVMKELTKKGLLDTSVLTCTGKTLAENLEGVVNRNPELIRTIENPYSADGGIAVLKGNPGPEGCVVKRSAVAPEMMLHTGPARVFNSEEEAITAIYAGKIVPGDVVVIRYEAPRAARVCGRCSTPPLPLRAWGWIRTWPDHRRAVLRRHPGRVHRTRLPGGGLRRDHRPGGGGRPHRHRHSRPHHQPEGGGGGAGRPTAKWVCPEPKIKTGYLARYAKLVSSADRGAILE